MTGSERLDSIVMLVDFGVSEDVVCVRVWEEGRFIRRIFWYRPVTCSEHNEYNEMSWWGRFCRTIGLGWLITLRLDEVINSNDVAIFSVAF